MNSVYLELMPVLNQMQNKNLSPDVITNARNRRIQNPRK